MLRLLQPLWNYAEQPFPSSFGVLGIRNFGGLLGLAATNDDDDALYSRRPCGSVWKLRLSVAKQTGLCSFQNSESLPPQEVVEVRDSFILFANASLSKSNRIVSVSDLTVLFY